MCVGFLSVDFPGLYRPLEPTLPWTALPALNDPPSSPAHFVNDSLSKSQTQQFKIILKNQRLQFLFYTISSGSSINQNYILTESKLYLDRI